MSVATFRTVLLLSLLCLAAAPLRAGDEPPLARIAFGSCARQDRPQPIWEAVVETRPGLFLFLGDNIYADTEDMDVLRAKYQMLADQPGFQKLKAACPVLATWDDHDYGANDAGAEYPKKKESQQVFLDFFGVPADSPRRTREGVYHSEVFGPEGKRVQAILLDGRYHRSPLTTGFQPGERGEGRYGKYVPNTDPEATMLGEEQWAWLEEQLRIPAELRLIGSGVQVVPDEHGSECWGNFPRERRRLLRLIRETGAAGVVFLSGDRHLAEISRLAADDEEGVGYPLFDVTSSSLNVPTGAFTKAGTRFVNEVNSYRVGLTYFETNFGLVDIDWDRPDPLVRLQVRDEQGDVVLQQRLGLSRLQPPADATSRRPAGRPERGGARTGRQDRTPSGADGTPIEHVRRDMEGWTVHIDRWLPSGEHAETGRLGLRILADKLHEIALVVPAGRLARLREVPVFVDLDHPLGNLQYHPDAGWLRRHGYDPAMAGAVHVPRLQRLVDLVRQNTQPWVMLHELAHAYHDRVLGFDHAPIRQAWERAAADGRYESVRHIDGTLKRHYALTDHKEFFAEMTECYFGTNDFYPFVRAELADFDPRTYELLEQVWRSGPAPSQAD